MAISYYKKYQDQIMDPAGVKDILGWETCTIACSGEQVNETAEALQNRNDCKVAWIFDNCCFVVDNALRQYFFYSKDTVVNDVIFFRLLRRLCKIMRADNLIRDSSQRFAL